MKNINVAELVCDLLDKTQPKNSFKNLINFVKDRPGHDYRYAIDSSKILKELNWKPKYNFKKALGITVDWCIDNKDWLIKKSSQTKQLKLFIMNSEKD